MSELALVINGVEVAAITPGEPTTLQVEVQGAVPPGLQPPPPEQPEGRVTETTFKKVTGDPFGDHGMGANYVLPGIINRGVKLVEFFQKGELVIAATVADSTKPVEFLMRGAYTMVITDEKNNQVIMKVGTSGRTFKTKWDYLVHGAYCFNARCVEV